MLLENHNAISEVGGNYQIANSLRFQSASTQYLIRTPASAGNRQKWTWSGWVKRGALGTSYITSAQANGNSGTSRFNIYFNANSLNVEEVTIGTAAQKQSGQGCLPKARARSRRPWTRCQPRSPSTGISTGLE